MNTWCRVLINIYYLLFLSTALIVIKRNKMKQGVRAYYTIHEHLTRQCEHLAFPDPTGMPRSWGLSWERCMWWCRFFALMEPQLTWHARKNIMGFHWGAKPPVAHDKGTSLLWIWGGHWVITLSWACHYAQQVLQVESVDANSTRPQPWSFQFQGLYI